jgi:hypothetical protein
MLNFRVPVVAHGDELSHTRQERRERARLAAVVDEQFRTSAEELERSPFGTPYLYLGAIESIYRSHHPECIARAEHDCLADNNCTHSLLPVRIYRRFSTLGRTAEYHICLPRECVHLTPNHVCRDIRCWHSPAAVYPDADVHDVPGIYVCSRSGRMHVCGNRCMHKYAMVTQAGLVVCRLTGVVTGTKLEHESEQSNLFGVDPPSGWDAIDYEQDFDPADADEDAVMSLCADAALVSASTGLTPRAASMSLLEGPAAPTRWTPSMSPHDLEELRKKRRKAVRAELEPFVASPANAAKGVLEAALKPVKDTIKAGATKRWPGVAKMMCRLVEATPKPLHPSWTGWRLDRSAAPSDHEKKIWQLMGYDEQDKSEPVEDDTVEATVMLFERLEQVDAVHGTRFETAVPALLKILDAGVLTEQGEAVKQRSLQWYSTRRSALLYAQWTEAVQKAFLEGRFGSCV